jgi:hypothetical protein
VTPFTVAWTLVAAYGTILLAVAVRIGILLARARGRASNQSD